MSTTPQSTVDKEAVRKRKEKTILYLRHKLQKGLVSREVPPKPEEMDAMAEHLSVLESHQDLEANIIRDTKAHKLLKVILKLKDIPRDAEFKFKDRCSDLLAVWSKTVAAADGHGPAAAETSTNGLAHGNDVSAAETVKLIERSNTTEATRDLGIDRPLDENTCNNSTDADSADNVALDRLAVDMQQTRLEEPSGLKNVNSKDYDAEPDRMDLDPSLKPSVSRALGVASTQTAMTNHTQLADGTAYDDQDWELV